MARNRSEKEPHPYAEERSMTSKAKLAIKENKLAISLRFRALLEDHQAAREIEITQKQWDEARERAKRRARLQAKLDKQVLRGKI